MASTEVKTTSSTTDQVDAPRIATFAGLREALGFTGDDHIAISHQHRGDEFHSLVVTLADADAEVANHAGLGDVWFGVNPTRQAVGSTARGTRAQVTRVTSVFCDLDVKAGGFASSDDAQGCIADISGVLVTRPTAVVSSGHGLQPYWPIEPEGAAAVSNAAGGQLLAAFGRLVGIMASRYGAKVDNVYELARVLRVPGTLNCKDPEHPVPVTALLDTGHPVTVEELTERLREIGVDPDDEDVSAVGAQVVSVPDDWYYDQTSHCPYVPKMVAGWASDTPSARNPWMFSQQHRIAAAHRLGCFPDREAHHHALALLESRFRWLLANTQQVRGERRFEFDGARSRAIEKVSKMTEQQAQAELGGVHNHDAQVVGTPGSATPATSVPKRWKANDLKTIRQAKFLARQRIPYGAVSNLCGDEGIGKSLFWVWIAAAVTTGKPLPEFGIPAREPANVILILTEDDWTTEVLPRLTVANADLNRIEVICTDADGTGSPVFPDDMHLITDESKPKPGLIVVDAWIDTVNAKLVVRDSQQSRTALNPWKEAAGKTGAAIILITHTNRLSTGNIRDKYGLTASLRQKARMTLFALQDPRDGSLIIGPDKSNSAPGGTRASRFTIAAEQYFNPTDDHDGKVPSVVYGGCTGKTIRQHLAEITEDEQRKTRRRNACEEWLIEFLAKGPRWSEDIYHAGRSSEGEFSEDQLKRAKAKVCGRAFHPDGDPRWWWELTPEYAVRASALEARSAANGEDG